MFKNPRFEYLYKRFSQPLFWFISKRIGANKDAVEDVFQETVTAAWKGYKTFKSKSSYFTWLCRIALNKIADYYRDQIHNKSRIVVPALKVLSQIESKDIPLDEQLILSDLRNKVNECLDLLPYDKRKLLWFRYWKGLSYDEIAKLLDISTRAVEGKLYRAKQTFAKVYVSKWQWETVAKH